MREPLANPVDTPPSTAPHRATASGRIPDPTTGGAEPPPVRRLVHPGTPAEHRIEHLQVARARHFRLLLEPGASLEAAIIRPLLALRLQSASLTLLGGRLTRLLYCVAPADASGERVANYTRPIDAGAASLIFGNATFGVSASGEPVVHCHATFVGADGRVRGGHIVVDRSNLGAEPGSALVTSLDGIVLRIGHDAETNMPLMRPYRAAPVAGSDSPGAVDPARPPTGARGRRSGSAAGGRGRR